MFQVLGFRGWGVRFGVLSCCRFKVLGFKGSVVFGVLRFVGS